MRSLREVTADVLTLAGAVVEAAAPEGLEVVAPMEVRQALSIPEWSLLGFGTELPYGARRVALEPDGIFGLRRLIQDRGRYLRMWLQPEISAKPPRDLEQWIAQQITLENATFRVREVTPAKTRYLLLSFRLAVVSDEKAEDLIQLCVNESNLAIADSMVEPLLKRLAEGNGWNLVDGSDFDLPPPWSARRVEEYSTKVLPPRVKLRLAPFLAGMERRMERDLQRLHTYHSELRDQAKWQPGAKSASNVGQDKIKGELSKLDWIEREYFAKIADTRRKYSATAEARLDQVLRLETEVWRVHVTILRKKMSRPMHADFCKICGTFERLPCDSCRNSGKTFVVCDEKLHLLCPVCSSPCPSCGKSFCRACRGTFCPRCAQRLQNRSIQDLPHPEG
ncbi:MAG: hypothetical protein HY644_08340 [Acidobacteria bacterium]|nr:hypothetical protein [Acidobacteriota bacterium]